MKERHFGCHIYKKHPTAAALVTCLLLQSNSLEHLDKITVALYCEAVRYPLNSYVPDDVIVETNFDMIWFKKLWTKSHTDFARAMGTKGTETERVYDTYVLKRSFIEGIFGTDPPLCEFIFELEEESYSS